MKSVGEKVAVLKPSQRRRLELIFLLAPGSGPRRTPQPFCTLSPPLLPSSLPLFAYSTLIWDPGVCVCVLGGRSNALTQRFKMSFKSHSLLLGLFYFPHVGLQGQFAPTADERSIGDLNLKSRGPLGGGQSPEHVVAGGLNLSPEAQHRPISSHPHLPKLG